MSATYAVAVFKEHTGTPREFVQGQIYTVTDTDEWFVLERILETNIGGTDLQIMQARMLNGRNNATYMVPSKPPFDNVIPLDGVTAYQELEYAHAILASSAQAKNLGSAVQGKAHIEQLRRMMTKNTPAAFAECLARVTAILHKNEADGKNSYIFDLTNMHRDCSHALAQLTAIVFDVTPEMALHDVHTLSPLKISDDRTFVKKEGEDKNAVIARKLKKHFPYKPSDVSLDDVSDSDVVHTNGALPDTLLARLAKRPKPGNQMERIGIFDVDEVYIPPVKRTYPSANNNGTASVRPMIATSSPRPALPAPKDHPKPVIVRRPAQPDRPRIAAQPSKTNTDLITTYNFGWFSIDEYDRKKNAYIVSNTSIAIKPAAFRLLLALNKQSGTIIPRDQLISEIFDGKASADTMLGLAIMDIRNHMDEIQASPHIDTPEGLTLRDQIITPRGKGVGFSKPGQQIPDIEETKKPKPVSAASQEQDTRPRIQNVGFGYFGLAIDREATHKKATIIGHDVTLTRTEVGVLFAVLSAPGEEKNRAVVADVLFGNGKGKHAALIQASHKPAQVLARTLNTLGEKLNAAGVDFNQVATITDDGITSHLQDTPKQETLPEQRPTGCGIK